MKYRSLFASLALIFEVVDYVGGESSGKSVGKSSAIRAAAWCGYLESHARRVYSPMIDTPLQAAADLLARIQVGDVEHGMKSREIRRKGWRGMTNTAELREIVGILEDHGWVRRVTVKPEGGGRPSERLHLHPELRG